MLVHHQPVAADAAEDPGAARVAHVRRYVAGEPLEGIVDPVERY